MKVNVDVYLWTLKVTNTFNIKQANKMTYKSPTSPLICINWYFNDSLLLPRKSGELTYMSYLGHKTELQYKQLTALLNL